MIRHYPDLLDELAEKGLDQLAEWVRRRRQFAGDEAPFILERLAAVQQYQERLVEKVRRLQAIEDQRALDEASIGSDLLLTVIART